jgi:hypothetical protein
MKWSNACRVTAAGNDLYSVSSYEFVKEYSLDFKTGTCDYTLVENRASVPVHLGLQSRLRNRD